MRRALSFSLLLYGLLVVSFSPAVSQTSQNNNADDGSPYGGQAVTPGSFGPKSTGAGPLTGSGSCGSGDPCVLTGQYNRYRTSANGNEASLAGFNNSNFGMAYFYPVSSTLPTVFRYEPIVAQPLYITNVSVPGASHLDCGGTGVCNMLLVASLNDYVYAFDTSTGNQLWSLNVQHCSTGGGPFLNNVYNGFPGASTLPYYGIVATPVIDTAPTDPTAFVTSACVTSASPASIQWYLDAVDLTTGLTRNSLPQALTDGTKFNAPNEISRAPSCSRTLGEAALTFTSPSELA